VSEQESAPEQEVEPQEFVPEQFASEQFVPEQEVASNGPAADASFAANGTLGPSSRTNGPLDPDIPAEPADETGPLDESELAGDTAPESEPESEPTADIAAEAELADEAATEAELAPEAEIDVPEADSPETAEAEPAAEADTDAPETAASETAEGGAEDSATAPVDEPTLDLVDPDRLRRAVEAVLLVVDEPVEVTTLAQTLAVPKPDVLTALTSLRDEYTEGERGMDLREVAGGWRLYTREEFAQYVERFVLDGQQTRLTQAALETLSVIAYRQPVTRSRISSIRGVGVDGVMRTLTSRGLVEECGTDAETGGGLYRTTSLFLEKLGLNSIEELPPLAPLLPDHTDLEDSALSDG
jgi:segregation and condensation protein B